MSHPQPPVRVFINERICEGCGDCGAKSNCLSVEPVDTLFGRKTQINQATCNFDYRCISGDCPAFLLVTPKGEVQAQELVDVDVAGLPPAPVTTPRQPYAVRIVGIGGTGVVTVSQVVATAATRAGLWVRSLDQTGLAQKGGSVISDVIVCAEPFTRSNRIAEGQCDAYLACDMLAGADAKTLAVASSDRTRGVVSTSQVPTGPMVADVTVTFPGHQLTVDRIRGRMRDGDVLDFDARKMAIEKFGTDVVANVIIVGAAHQLGLIPIPTEALEWAFTVNGVDVARNLQAFRLGRSVAAELGWNGEAESAVRPQALPGGVSSKWFGESLEDMLAFWADDLTSYQSKRYSQDFLQYMESVRMRVSDHGGGDAVTRIIGRNLYKLMAYKDEYEVARLALGADVGDAIARTFGDRSTVQMLLHPPMLRAIGFKNKLRFGRMSMPVFGLLRAMRRLRGSKLDLFGLPRVRRVERELIPEYRELVDRALLLLTPETEQAVMELVGLPDMVRGYEDIKLANVEAYRVRVTEQLGQLESTHA